MRSPGIKYAYGHYSFAQMGGAVSTITLASERNVLPAKAIILGGTIDITTALASQGLATIALGTTSGSSTTSLKGATAVASWGTGQLALVPAFTQPTMFKLTAGGSITMTIAVADLTAGEFEVHLLYVLSST